MMPRYAGAIAVGLVLGGLAAGCGGGDDEPSGSAAAAGAAGAGGSAGGGGSGPLADITPDELKKLGVDSKEDPNRNEGCPTVYDGKCNEPVRGDGTCAAKSDWWDCNYCPWPKDGICDHPGFSGWCPNGTDEEDCAGQKPPETCSTYHIQLLEQCARMQMQWGKLFCPSLINCAFTTGMGYGDTLPLGCKRCAAAVAGSFASCDINGATANWHCAAP